MRDGCLVVVIHGEIICFIPTHSQCGMHKKLKKV